MLLLTRAFQSTPSGGKATRLVQLEAAPNEVSIHAFRGEGDNVGGITVNAAPGFNPRLPGGRRPDADGQAAGVADVSIHAFRGEGDRCRG